MIFCMWMDGMDNRQYEGRNRKGSKKSFFILLRHLKWRQRQTKNRFERNGEFFKDLAVLRKKNVAVTDSQKTKGNSNEFLLKSNN